MKTKMNASVSWIQKRLLPPINQQCNQYIDPQIQNQECEFKAQIKNQPKTFRKSGLLEVLKLLLDTELKFKVKVKVDLFVSVLEGELTRRTLQELCRQKVVEKNGKKEDIEEEVLCGQDTYSETEVYKDFLTVTFPSVFIKKLKLKDKDMKISKERKKKLQKFRKPYSYDIIFKSLELLRKAINNDETNPKTKPREPTSSLTTTKANLPSATQQRSCYKLPQMTALAWIANGQNQPYDPTLISNGSYCANCTDPCLPKCSRKANRSNLAADTEGGSSRQNVSNEKKESKILPMVKINGKSRWELALQKISSNSKGLKSFGNQYNDTMLQPGWKMPVKSGEQATVQKGKTGACLVLPPLCVSEFWSSRGVCKKKSAQETPRRAGKVRDEDKKKEPARDKTSQQACKKPTHPPFINSDENKSPDDDERMKTIRTIALQKLLRRNMIGLREFIDYQSYYPDRVSAFPKFSKADVPNKLIRAAFIGKATSAEKSAQTAYCFPCEDANLLGEFYKGDCVPRDKTGLKDRTAKDPCWTSVPSFRSRVNINWEKFSSQPSAPLDPGRDHDWLNDDCFVDVGGSVDASTECEFVVFGEQTFTAKERAAISASRKGI